VQERKEEQGYMSLTDLQGELQQLAAPLDVVIVSLAWSEFNGNKVLELLIDHPAGVDVDLCAQVSELLVETVDRYMVEEENFYFEVASTGVETPIQTLAALEAACGRWIHIELNEPIDGHDVYEGTLQGVVDRELTLEYKDKTQRKTLKTTWDNVKSARYAVEL
jgi:ribosome maturation factor RimP